MLRLVALLLLLANAGYFAWSQGLLVPWGVGPAQQAELSNANADFRACRERPNVHLLGERHRSQVPAYLLHIDVNIMIYSLSPDSWTHLAYPLKLHEYLASGRPVVSVPLAMIQEFASAISFVEGVDAWDAALTHALTQDSLEQRAHRRSLAEQHSWEARAEVLGSWLDELPQLRAARVARSGS